MNPITNNLDIELIKHETAESVLIEHFNFEKDPNFSMEDIGTIGGATESGEEVETSPEQILEGIKAAGFWGFADSNTRKVHVWVSPEANAAEVVFFLAHEIGHLTGEQIGDDLAEEKRADSFGEAASLAFNWINKLSGISAEGEQFISRDKVIELLQSEYRYWQEESESIEATGAISNVIGFLTVENFRADWHPEKSAASVDYVPPVAGERNLHAFKLKVSERQLNIIQAALDLYGRLLMGQINSSLWNLYISRDIDHDRFEEICRVLKQTVFPELHPHASYSVGWNESTRQQKMQIAYEIEAMIRHERWKREENRSSWVTSSSPPLHYSREPFIRLEEIEPVRETPKNFDELIEKWENLQAEQEQRFRNCRPGEYHLDAKQILIRDFVKDLKSL